MIWERRFKLKPEYQGLAGHEIRDVRLSGTEVSAEVRMPLLAYTGDTSPSGLDNNPEFYNAQVLITEMTFVSPKHRREKIHKHGHMHLDDFIARSDRFENELVIASHFSVRYNTPQVLREIERKIPGLCDGRLKPWI